MVRKVKRGDTSWCYFFFYGGKESTAEMSQILSVIRYSKYAERRQSTAAMRIVVMELPRTPARRMG
jgi:hypothetical protein